MQGINTVSYSALVIDFHTFGDWAVGEFIAEAMGAGKLPVGSDVAVPTRVKVSHPEPVSIRPARAVYLRPKSFKRRLAAINPFWHRGSPFGAYSV